MKKYQINRDERRIDKMKHYSMCQVDGCCEPHHAKGYCTKHYQRYKIYKDPAYPNQRFKRRENSHKWKGGRVINHDGYILIYQKDHPSSHTSGYVLEHRYNMEIYLGRLLKPDEFIHHKDGNRQNNDINNLEILDHSTHSKLHAKENPMIQSYWRGRKQTLKHRLLNSIAKKEWWRKRKELSYA